MALLLAPAELDHTRATANLSVEGLAMTHFDAGRRTWEINFLRNSDHVFTLVVRGNGVLREIPIGDTIRDISVTAVRGIVPDFEQFPHGYWFSNQFFLRPIDQGHPQDFRWVPDLANRTEFLLHAVVRPGGGMSTTIDSVTKLAIPNVIFYTRQRTWYPLTKAIGNIVDPFPFGKTNTMIGADIFCEDGGAVVIKIGADELPPLPHVPGSPYQIKFENSDNKRFPPDRLIQGEFIRGDFALYYEFLDVTGAHYDMLCPKAVYVTSDCDCNPSFVSQFD